MSILRQAVLGSVTEAYDAVEQALNEVRSVAPDAVAPLEEARDALFSARVTLADEEE